MQHVDEEKEKLIEEIDDVVVGSKRKATVRGPGRKVFKSSKTAGALSRSLADAF